MSRMYVLFLKLSSCESSTKMPEKNTIAFRFLEEKAALTVLKLGIFVSVMKSASALTLAACEKYS